MAVDNSQRPIIIKKVKKGHHAHHGGAWKVAYADFVTAMMAFFLMLWLLASASDAQLEGLAEYFTPTIGVKDSMGIGFKGGESPEEDGIKKTDLSPPGIIVGKPPQGITPEDPVRDTLIDAEKDAKLFEKAEEAVKQAFESDPNMRDLSENIIVEQSPEGLKIDIVDSDKHPMFTTGSAVLSDFGRRTLTKMNAIIKDTPNFVSITGHTDATPFGTRADYTNWELSADRANAARRFLLSVGMDKERPKKVVGMADAELLLPEDPKAARNRRITIILLRGNYMSLMPQHLPATRDLLSIPGAERRASTPAVPARPDKPLTLPQQQPAGDAMEDPAPTAPLKPENQSTPVQQPITPGAPSSQSTAPATPPAAPATPAPAAPARTPADMAPFVDN